MIFVKPCLQLIVYQARKLSDCNVSLNSLLVDFLLRLKYPSKEGIWFWLTPRISEAATNWHAFLLHIPFASNLKNPSQTDFSSAGNLKRKPSELVYQMVEEEDAWIGVAINKDVDWRKKETLGLSSWRLKTNLSEYEEDAKVDSLEIWRIERILELIVGIECKRWNPYQNSQDRRFVTVLKKKKRVNPQIRSEKWVRLFSTANQTDHDREARIFLGFLNWARTRPVAFLYGPRPGASSLIDTRIHHPSLILTLTLTKHQKLHLPLHLLYLHPTSYLSLTISSSSHIIFTLTSLNLPPPTLSYRKTTSLHRHSHIAKQPSLYRHSHIAKQPSLHQEIAISLSIPSFNTRPWA